MNRLSSAALGVLLLCALGGCVIAVDDDHMDRGWGAERDDWRQRQERNREAIAELELGRHIDSVVDELGPADFNESFVRDGLTYRVLRYRTHRVHDDGRTTRDETEPLVFVDGELVGWGESAIEFARP